MTNIYPDDENNVLIHNRDYPGILSACHIDWMMDWPSDALYGELAKYIEKHSLLDNVDSNIKYVYYSIRFVCLSIL